jgi:hypothetical protein
MEMLLIKRSGPLINCESDGDVHDVENQSDRDDVCCLYRDEDCANGHGKSDEVEVRDWKKQISIDLSCIKTNRLPLGKATVTRILHFPT